MSASFTRGAAITSNSWGAPVSGAYDSSSQAYDALTRDASDATPGNQPMLHVFSAGNRGPRANSIGSPGTAKNVITVGGTENVRDQGVVRWLRRSRGRQRRRPGVVRLARPHR